MSLKCDGCTACCAGPIYRLPEDSPQLPWITLPDGRDCLPTHEDGRCIYAGEGCAVYQHRPVMCRLFDCRLALVKGLKLEPAIAAAARRQL